MKEVISEQLINLDWKLLVSILALLLSLGTFYTNIYFQKLKKASLNVIIGDHKYVNYGQKGELIMGVPLTMYNEGARLTSVLSVKGQIYNIENSNQSSKLTWRQFYEFENIGRSGEVFKPHRSFKSHPTTIILEGYSAAGENISFRTENDFHLTPGTYMVEFAFYDHHFKKIATASEKLNFTKENVEYLDEYCVINDKRVSSDSLLFTKNIQYSWRTNQ
ncbi:hypothetical protein [Ferrimonas balearica]|uniref:hypothetical protein n=1 Tax=Ferrimonas balearica TaxID=44012 RepID=UPI001C993518|nr:hypothetical protein [Ferrimonas balearica]MBY5990898.1 hypothetical protein [Ferrimonas balearica]